MSAEAPKAELFLSYGRAPGVTAFVRELKLDLEAEGFSVWLDACNIPAGCDWHGAIGAGLDECSAFLPIITNKYLGSRYCVNEVRSDVSPKSPVFV